MLVQLTGILGKVRNINVAAVVWLRKILRADQIARLEVGFIPLEAITKLYELERIA